MQQLQESYNKALSFAAMKHEGQTLPGTNLPYLIHVTSVAMELLVAGAHTMNFDVPFSVSVALLHDTLEDTPVTTEQINEFLLPLIGVSNTGETISLVIELTDVFIKKDYPQWNRRKRKEKEADRLANVSANAQTIKYADIIDNGLTIIDANDDFKFTFLKECKALLRLMTKGNHELHRRAIETIDQMIIKSHPSVR